MAIFVRHCLSRLWQFAHKYIIFWTVKHLIYPFVFRRHRFLTPITRFHFLLQSVYWIGTFICSSFGVRDLREAGARAGALAVIQFMPLFFGNHLSFAADLLGISLRSYRRFHSSAGLMAGILGSFHVAINLRHGTNLNLKNQMRLYGFIVRANHSLLCWHCLNFSAIVECRRRRVLVVSVFATLSKIFI